MILKVCQHSGNFLPTPVIVLKLRVNTSKFSLRDRDRMFCRPAAVLNTGRDSACTSVVCCLVKCWEKILINNSLHIYTHYMSFDYFNQKTFLLKALRAVVEEVFRSFA